MKKFIYKLFLWIRDRFSFLFAVFIRLSIGKNKKENSQNKLRGEDSHNNKEV